MGVRLLGGGLRFGLVTGLENLRRRQSLAHHQKSALRRATSFLSMLYVIALWLVVPAASAALVPAEKPLKRQRSARPTHIGLKPGADETPVCEATVF
jgi:hypothetical protein